MQAFFSPEAICLGCLLQGVNPWIEVDGGVTPKNAYKVKKNLDTVCLQKKHRVTSLLFIFEKVIEAGANALVAGSAVFGAKDYAEGIYIYIHCLLPVN